MLITGCRRGVPKSNQGCTQIPGSRTGRPEWWMASDGWFRTRRRGTLSSIDPFVGNRFFLFLPTRCRLPVWFRVKSGVVGYPALQYNSSLWTGVRAAGCWAKRGIPFIIFIAVDILFKACLRYENPSTFVWPNRDIPLPPQSPSKGFHLLYLIEYELSQSHFS